MIVLLILCLSFFGLIVKFVWKVLIKVDICIFNRFVGRYGWFLLIVLMDGYVGFVCLFIRVVVGYVIWCLLV